MHKNENRYISYTKLVNRSNILLFNPNPKPCIIFIIFSGLESCSDDRVASGRVQFFCRILLLSAEINYKHLNISRMEKILFDIRLCV